MYQLAWHLRVEKINDHFTKMLVNKFFVATLTNVISICNYESHMTIGLTRPYLLEVAGSSYLPL